MEPELTFSFLENTLMVFLAYNLNPLGIDSETYSFQIEISEQDIGKMIEAVEKMILKFPKKYNPY